MNTTLQCISGADFVHSNTIRSMYAFSTHTQKLGVAVFINFNFASANEEKIICIRV